MRELDAILICKDCGCMAYRLELEPIINEKTGEESCAKRHVVEPYYAGQKPCNDPSNLSCPDCHGPLIRK